MMVNHDVTDRMENIPDDKFKIIGIDKDAEAPSRPRIGYWRDAWRRLRENKVAFVALIILLPLAAMNLNRLTRMRLTRGQARSTGSVRMIWEETYLPEYGRQDGYPLSSVSWAR